MEGQMNYTELLNCKTPEEVIKKVTAWSSGKSFEEHKIRSAILDIHASVEQYLKVILFETLFNTMPIYNDEKVNLKNKEKLNKTIEKMNFSVIHKLLKPSLDAYDSPDLDNLQPINECRNQVAHRDLKDVKYKGKNPFIDTECLAQYFIECWSVKKMLSKFLGKMILDPRAKALDFEKSYYQNIGQLE
jgi:hypothetical protein